MKKTEAYSLISRYLLALLFGTQIWILYFIFTPITSYLSYYSIKIFYSEAILINTSIILEKHTIELIPACIAGAAYYLLLLLNLSISMNLTARAKSLLFLLISFLIINIIRITAFSILFINNYSNLQFTHEMVWYLGSTVIVIGVWFANVFLFKIKNIPIFTDIKNIYKDSSFRKKH